MEQMLKVISKTASSMCKGEIEELLDSYKLNITEEKYAGIIGKKTAALFAVSCEIGSILAKAKEDEVKKCRDYGLNIGMAFQIVDDILDYTGSRSKLGKPAASDLMEGKITLPLIYALKYSDDRDKNWLRRTILAAKKNKHSLNGNIKKVRDIFKKYNCVDLAYKKAENYIGSARKAISAFPDNKYKKALYDLSAFIVKREF